MNSIKQHFPIVIEMDEDGMYIVSCPMFSGCHSYGETIDEAMTNIAEAIELCAEERRENLSNRFIGIRDLEVAVA